MSSPEETKQAADLIERLLTDPTFRAEFRRDPAKACEQFGLAGLAEELRAGSGAKALYTLELRQSMSSLAGVIMAAAAEGVGALELFGMTKGTDEHVAGVVNEALSRTSLQAIKAVPSTDGHGHGSHAAGPGESHEHGGRRPAREDHEDRPKSADGHGHADGKGGEAGHGHHKPASGDEPAGHEHAPRARSGAGGGTVNAVAVAHEDAPPAAQPAHEDAPPPAEKKVPPPPHEDAPAKPHEDAQIAAVADAVPASGELESLLANPNLELPPDARADLASGRVDPRLVSVLTALTKEHKIGLSVIITGHDQFSSSGSVSNHFVGRGLDIASVDGEIVRPDSIASRELAEALVDLPESIKPSEVGTPWSINAPGFFTDGGHQDHLHIAFDDPAPEGFASPVAAAAPAAAPAPPGAGPGGGLESGVFAGVDQPPADGGRATVSVVPAVPEQPAAPAAPEEVQSTPADAPAETPAAVPTPVADVAVYPGDDAPKEELAAWMAARAQAAGLPAELPVMAALVESRLSNVNFGDADSIGFFQMRTSIWDQGEYAGYGSDPEKQIKWFIDHAVHEKEKRVGRGDTAFLTDPSKWGEWIADVERPAEQYRGRYQERLAEAQELLGSAGGAAPPAAPAADPAAAAAAAGAAAAPEAEAPASGVFAIAGAPEPAGGGTPTVSVLQAVEEAPAAADAFAAPVVPPGGGPVAPVAPEDMANTNEGGKLHASEFDVQDAEGAPGPEGNLHAGYDLFARAGAPVRAPIGGTVVEVKASTGNSGQIFGGVVKVQGADGRVWVFRHVDPKDVVEGGTVTAGQEIATVTEWTGGTHHAHIELWKTLEGGYSVPNMDDPYVELQKAYASGGAVLPPDVHAPGPAADADHADHDHAAEGGELAAAGPAVSPSAQLQALLDNPNLELPGAARADLASGRVDPRLVAVLSELTKEHKVGLSVIISGHDQFSSSGSVSNHFVGRGLDIASVDGEIVRPNSFASRELAEALADLPESIKPTEVGTPWSINAPGFFTDGGHQDHIHVAYDDPPPEGFQAPAAPAAPATPVAAADAVPAAPETPAVAPEPEGEGLESGVFAVAGEADADAAARSGNTVQFMRAVEDEVKEKVEQPPEPDADLARVAAPEVAAVVGGYPGDGAPKEQLAAWMAARAQAAGLPPELPVMAALVESRLSNVNYGDADSIGFFQMRTSIWDQGEYAGYGSDPEKQIKWFIDHAVHERQKRVADGYTNFLTDESKWGDWVADVERPAEQYRGRYQERLAEARALLAKGGVAPS